MADMPGDNNSPVQSKSTPDHMGQSQCVCTHQFTVCVEKINTALIQNQEEAWAAGDVITVFFTGNVITGG